MKMMKGTAAVLLVYVLLWAMSGTALALDVPDTAGTGSVSLTMAYDGKAVPGGTLTAYRAGEIAEDDGNYSFVLTPEFADSGAELGDISSPALAASLADYAGERRLTGTAVNIGEDGKALFPDLEPGLYLIVQTQAAGGFEAVSPFLVSVPMNENGVYVYDVDATPKMGPLTRTPEQPAPPVPPTEPTLPQTGQLNWPVPALAGLGLCLLLLGWALRAGRRGKAHET